MNNIVKLILSSVGVIGAYWLIGWWVVKRKLKRKREARAEQLKEVKLVVEYLGNEIKGIIDRLIATEPTMEQRQIIVELAGKLFEISNVYIDAL